MSSNNWGCNYYIQPTFSTCECSSCEYSYSENITCESCNCSSCNSRVSLKNVLVKYTINDIPSELINGTPFSYQTIAQDLENVLKILFTIPIFQQFVASNATFNASMEEQLNRQLELAAENYVSTPLNYNYPGYGFSRRITLISSSGDVLIDTSYMNPNSSVTNALIPNAYILTNPSQILSIYDYSGVKSSGSFPLSISKKLNIRVIKQTRNSFNSQPVPSTPNVPSEWNYFEYDLHTCRDEIIIASTRDYGWNQRLSDTVGRYSYYVAKKLVFGSQYVFYARISYEKVPL
jgi:hypothetical protein